MNYRDYSYIIGIDPGTNTGFAIWDVKEKKLIEVGTMVIHKALAKVLDWAGMGISVRVEDARKRNWFGASDREKLQGAGSIKRDCAIWEDFLTDNKIDFEMVAPKNNKTKLTQPIFKRITLWPGQTNLHGRDAGMLVFGL